MKDETKLWLDYLKEKLKKCPVSNVLPNYEPNKALGNKGISIAKSVLGTVQNIIK